MEIKIYIYEAEAQPGTELSHKLLFDVIPERGGAELMYGPQGKPYFAEGPHFSISHTGRQGEALWALAVSDDGPVGLDLQEMRPAEYVKLAERFFTPQEAEYIKRFTDVPGGENSACTAFYRIWCRKEAFVKYTGRGFAETGFDSFSVLNENGEPAGDICLHGVDAVFKECARDVLPPDLAERYMCVICSAVEADDIEKVQLTFTR